MVRASFIEQPIQPRRQPSRLNNKYSQYERGLSQYQMLDDGGVKHILLPPKSPRSNAVAELYKLVEIVFLDWRVSLCELQHRIGR